MEATLADWSNREINRRLERLVEEVSPIIRAIIYKKWRRPAAGSAVRGGGTFSELAADLRGEVLANLLPTLRELAQDTGAARVGDVRAFAAVTTYRVCDAHLRTLYPRRTALKDRLCYLLGRKAGTRFALWTGSRGARIGGLAAWRAAGRDVVRTARYGELLRDPRKALDAMGGVDCSGCALGINELSRIVDAVFEWVGGPVEIDDLVTVVAEVAGLQEPVACERQSAEEGAEDEIGNAADPRVQVAGEVEQRAYLRQLWEQIRELPSRQAAALLFNLRDPGGRGVLALLPLLGIAGMREIAAAVALSPEQLAALWNDLPMDDHGIAALLGCSRQQVIGLRKVARERLLRRMKRAE